MMFWDQCLSHFWNNAWQNSEGKKIYDCPEDSQSIDDDKRNKKPALSPWPSTSLRGKQIKMYILDTSNRQFEIIPEKKFQYKWTMIQKI